MDQVVDEDAVGRMRSANWRVAGRDLGQVDGKNAMRMMLPAGRRDARRELDPVIDKNAVGRMRLLKRTLRAGFQGPFVRVGYAAKSRAGQCPMLGVPMQLSRLARVRRTVSLHVSIENESHYRESHSYHERHRRMR